VRSFDHLRHGEEPLGLVRRIGENIVALVAVGDDVTADRGGGRDEDVAPVSVGSVSIAYQ